MCELAMTGRLWSSCSRNYFEPVDPGSSGPAGFGFDVGAAFVVGVALDVLGAADPDFAGAGFDKEFVELQQFPGR
jgi:hypothetical protein